MRKNYVVLILGGALAVLIAFGAIRLTQSPAAAQIHTMEADYPVYRSVGQIANAATLVVRGRVTQVLPAYRVIPNTVPVNQLPAHKAKEAGYLQTDVVVTIDTVIAGPAAAQKTAINVVHYGGELAGSKYVMEGEPLSVKGQSYLLFLRETAPGRYMVVGGPQGRYLIRQDRLTPVSAEAAEHFPLVGMLSGMNATGFAQNFSSLKSSPALAIPDAASPAVAPNAEAPAVAPANKPAHP